MRVLLAALITLLHPLLTPLSTVVEAQAGRERETFEVASIKINRSASGEPTVIRGQPSGLNATNATALNLIRYAFGVFEREIVGELPDWVRTTRFDVAARAADGPLTYSRVSAMTKALLEDRFRLEVAFEQAQGPVYALVMNGKPEQYALKAGRGLRSSESECIVDPLLKPFDPTPLRVLIIEACGISMGLSGGSVNFIFGSRVTMQQLAGWLSRLDSIDRPVVDRTGLTGEFDLAAGTTADMVAPTGHARFLIALREQLGLTLRAEEGSFEVLRVRRIEQPSPN